MQNRRVCVYFDFKAQDGEILGSKIRMYSSSATLNEILKDCERLAGFDEGLYGLRVFFEDSLVPAPMLDKS